MNKKRRKQLSLLKANLRLARVHIALAVQCMNKAKLLEAKRKAKA